MKPNLTQRSNTFAIFLVAGYAMITGASAQIHPNKSTPKVVCPAVAGVPAARLYGAWAVQFVNPPVGMPSTATMLLERHAEFSESLAGTVNRAVGVATGSAAAQQRSIKAALAGDFEDGILILDESSNSINITGTWNGEMVAGSCGKEFRGNWKDTSSSAPANAPDVPFTLRKLP